MTGGIFMLCKYCGAEIEDDVVTCTSCGKTLSE
ncbi:MAG: zinc-ribbon domain-containing protein, partial [Clostridia bacterium]|nr:zinc-ribbon domain-containing protein [Clostridia bacterium]